MAFTYTTPEDGTVEVDRMPLYGIERAAGVPDDLPTAPAQVRFQAYDDDATLVAVGLLDDDDDCVNQAAALRYAEADQGATQIVVLRGDEWVQEIG